jgi:XTP/dITP diphosphohydrolase
MQRWLIGAVANKQTMARDTRIVFATGNAGKAREVQQMLGDKVKLVLQAEFDIEPVEETGITFEDNALLKARHAAKISGLSALADDSGLEVDALAGAPGVYSARYAGADASDTDNVDKLLRELRSVPGPQRAARFCCALAFVRSADDPAPVIVQGYWEGSIALETSGQAGFGYDPVFIDGLDNCTSAELDPAVKNVRSHRGKALKKLVDLLPELYG